MPHVAADRVKETTATTGTGALTLAGAAAGFRALSAVMANGDTTFYSIQHQSSAEWEVGLGTWGTGGILTRTTVIASSNAGAAVNFSAGTKDVFITSPAVTQGWGVLAPAELTANQNDYNPTGLQYANTLRLTADQFRRITGLAGGYEGRVLTVLNVSTNVDGVVILNYEDGASAAANRFAIDNDLVLEPGCAAVLQYNATLQRWGIVAVRRKYTGDTFRTTPFYCTDFLGAAGADTGEATYALWDYAVISSGTQSKIAAEPTHPGILRTSSSTTANSGGYCRTDATSFRLAGGEVSEHVFRIQTLTTTTIRLGFLDTATSADAVDGAYIEIPATGAAVGKTSNNSTRSTSGTIATLSTGVWYRAKIVVNRAANAVDFYLFDDSGNLLGSQQLTANIPTAAGRETGHGYVATNSGTTAVALVDMDYMAIEFSKALVA